jgi:hypothetical protein
MTTVQTVKLLAGRGIKGKYKVEVNPNATAPTRVENGELIYQLKSNKFSELSQLIRDTNVGSSIDQVFDEMRVLLGEGVVVTSPNAEIPSGDFKLFITQKDGKQGIDFDEEFTTINERLDDIENSVDSLHGKINHLINLVKNSQESPKAEQNLVYNTKEYLSQEDLDDLALLSKL